MELIISVLLAVLLFQLICLPTKVYKSKQEGHDCELWIYPNGNMKRVNMINCPACRRIISGHNKSIEKMIKKQKEKNVEK